MIWEGESGREREQVVVEIIMLSLQRIRYDIYGVDWTGGVCIVFVI